MPAKPYSLDEYAARRVLSDVSCAVAEMIMCAHPAKDADHATRLIEIVHKKIKPFFNLPNDSDQPRPTEGTK